MKKSPKSLAKTSKFQKTVDSKRVNSDFGQKHAKKERKGRFNNRKGRKPKKSEFTQAVQDLRKLVYPKLEKFQQKQYEDVKLRAIGGTFTAKRKMPLPELVARRKATKAHIEKRLDTEKELNVKLLLGKQANLAEATRLKEKSKKSKEAARRAQPKYLPGHAAKGGVFKLPTKYSNN